MRARIGLISVFRGLNFYFLKEQCHFGAFGLLCNLSSSKPCTIHSEHIGPRLNQKPGNTHSILAVLTACIVQWRVLVNQPTVHSSVYIRSDCQKNFDQFRITEISLSMESGCVEVACRLVIDLRSFFVQISDAFDGIDQGSIA